MLSHAGDANAQELLFPNSDFEQGTLVGWTVEGDAFQHQPTRGDNTRARNRESANLQGNYWIGGYEKYTDRVGRPGDIAGDSLVGTLTSVEFLISRPYITFRIGAGDLPGEVGVRLLVDAKEIELATGGDSETMELHSVDVQKYVGKHARIQIFDRAQGGWGHINVDDFRATDLPAPSMRKEFALLEGISSEGYPSIQYDQAHRPQFHFCSRKNWLNDPNGMVFDGTKYHLFFQHNPSGTAWGNMTWGHAISSDMVHWKQQDHKLLPYRVDGRAGTIFSGTAVVDHNNSLGKQRGDTKTICAFFTFAAKPKFYQAMAYSTDGGNTFTYWNEGRAVVENQGFDTGERDPKVFWHEKTQRWVMALWVQQKPGRVRWFTSQNLTDWSLASDLMRDWAFECMDVVFLPLDGDQSNTRCVIYDASFDYEVGTFDGRQFLSETEPLRIVEGNFYAAQTFNHAPAGRVVQMGWMRGDFNAADHFDVPHNQQMAFPCELQLRSTPQGPRLKCLPISEIHSLVARTYSKTDIPLAAGVPAVVGFSEHDLLDVDLEFSPENASEIVFQFPSVTIKYDADKQTLTHRGVSKGGQPIERIGLEKLSPRDGRISLRLLIDRMSLEVYANDGERFAAHYIYPNSQSVAGSVICQGGHATLNQFTVRELRSAWK
jgi:sucrose-6-phosphate hydrolase SacC (GH32 family)